ncbi:MAG: hypothetical protein ACNA7I_07750 [Candidatus Methanoperedens sp.]
MTIIPDEIKPKFSPNVPEKEEDIKNPRVERKKNGLKLQKNLV